MSTEDRVSHRGTPPIKREPTANSQRQRQAFKRMSVCEAETGLTEEQLDEFHRAQRERVLRRYGVAA